MKFLKFFFFLSLVTFIYSCSQKEEVEVNEENKYYSIEDIQDIKDWILEHRGTENDLLDSESFPDVSFTIEATNTDADLLRTYVNGISYVNDAIINGEVATYKNIIDAIENNALMDESGKAFLQSVIQLSKEIFTSPDVIEFYKEHQGQEVMRDDPCGCDNAYASYVQAQVLCENYGWNWPHYCTNASNAYSSYLSCLEREITCPPGFTYDGANCYSGVHIPEGYTGFIWGNGFYTVPNCEIPNNDDCCPPGFSSDGVNCHYWGLYFSRHDYNAWIWNNTFYVTPLCE